MKEQTLKGQVMDIQKFLKIYSNEGILFEPLNADMDEAFVDEVYSIEEISGVGQKVNGRWIVSEIN